MIGLTFPVKGSDKRTSVPWNIVEAHRAAIEAKYGMPLERLAAIGIVAYHDLAALIGGTELSEGDDAHALLDEHCDVLKKGNYMKHVGKLIVAAGLALALLFPVAGRAQTIGGNASISASGTTARAAFPVDTKAYPYALIAPATGTADEIFYKLGNSSVAATTSSAALPSGGVCVNIGPNTNVAAITGGTSDTVRITQVTNCPFFSGGSGGSGGGGGSVTQGTTPWTDQGAGASGSALVGNPFRVGLSDGTNNQNWLAAIALADGVNGNNTAAVAPWLWNGTTYDRASGTAAKGQYVQAKSAAFASGSIASGAMVDLAPIAPTVSASAESSHVLKSGAGNLASLTTTIGAITGWIMLFDATSAPADGAVTPKFCRYVKSDGTGGSNSLSWNNLLVFSTGITAVFSSTGCTTKTASATAFFSAQVQ